MTAAAAPRAGVAIVTGAGGGLGRETSRALVASGYDLVLVGRDEHRLTAAADYVASADARRRTMAVALDVRREGDMAYMAEATVSAFGRIDVLVTCAGVARPATAGLLPRPLSGVTRDEWDELVDTNLTGVFLSNRAVFATMEAQQSGDILNVISEPAGRIGQPYAAAYAASKRAAAAFSEALAAVARPLGIRAQHFSPGVIDTPMVQGTRIARPWLRPTDVAEVIVRLVSLPRDCRMERVVLTPPSAPPALSIGAMP